MVLNNIKKLSWTILIGLTGCTSNNDLDREDAHHVDSQIQENIEFDPLGVADETEKYLEAMSGNLNDSKILRKDPVHHEGYTFNDFYFYNSSSNIKNDVNKFFSRFCRDNTGGHYSLNWCKAGGYPVFKAQAVELITSVPNDIEINHKLFVRVVTLNSSGTGQELLGDFKASTKSQIDALAYSTLLSLEQKKKRTSGLNLLVCSKNFNDLNGLRYGWMLSANALEGINLVAFNNTQLEPLESASRIVTYPDVKDFVPCSAQDVIKLANQGKTSLSRAYAVFENPVTNQAWQTIDFVLKHGMYKTYNLAE